MDGGEDETLVPLVKMNEDIMAEIWMFREMILMIQ